MYKRILEERIKHRFFSGKAIILAGARQTGKTTLITELLKVFKGEEVKRFVCDNPTDRDFLNNKDLSFLKKLIGKAKFLFIDEGQKVATIGQTLKLLVDHYRSSLQIIVTGSSSFNLLDSTQEALTGRKFVFTLYPLGLKEIYPGKDAMTISKGLADLLIYGSYPEIVSAESFDDKVAVLRELTSSYLYKDILELQQIHNCAVLSGLLKALALQIGSEVSYNELSNLLGIDKKTVERYIDLLEKNFVIFRLPPYSGNKRREISKLRKIYFYDTGIRNAIINNFNPPDSRDDTGALWENFMVAERMKFREYRGVFRNQYFWRTYDGSEVDLVEEESGRLDGFEFKRGSRCRIRAPASWLANKGASFSVVSPDNLEGFIL